MSDESFNLWKPEPDLNVIEATYKALMESWLLGLRFAKSDDTSDFSDFGLSFDLKYEDAIKIAGSRKAVTPSDYKKLSAHIKQQAFTVGRLAQLDMIKRAKDVYLKAIDAEKVGDIGAFIKEMATVDPSAAGMVGYYQMVYRTNIQSDYNAAKAWSMDDDPPEFLQFVAIEDERTSDICSARAGIVLPYTDPFWDNNWPPLHYNCRSTVREIDNEEAEAMGLIKDGKATIERPRKLNGAQSTFGKRPTKDNAFWGSSPSQHARIVADMIEDELNGVAGQTVCKDFSKAKEGYTSVEVSKGGLRYEDGIEKKSLDKTLEAAKKIVENKGCYIELDKATDLKWNKSSSGWMNGVEKIQITSLSSSSSRTIKNSILDGFKKADTVAASVNADNLDATKEAIKSLAKTLKDTRPNAKIIMILCGDDLITLSMADLQDEKILSAKLGV